MALASPQNRARPASSDAPRILSIQYLRAIAVLMVVAFHAASRAEEGLPSFLRDHMTLGHAGVDLFFVISGFIIWTIGATTSKTPGDFLIRRVVRIAPPYWLATFFWVGMVFVSGANWASLDPSHILRSLLFIPHWSPTFEGRFWPVLVPGWTLIFEAFFYLLFALTLVFRQNRLLIVSVLILGLVLAGGVFDMTSAPFIAFTSPLLLEFLAGILLAELCRHYRCHSIVAGALVAAGVLVITTFGGIVTTDQTSWSRPLIFGVGCALVVYGLVCLEDHLPYWPFLERLGDGSYAAYLFHIPILVLLLAIWNRMSWGETIEGTLAYVSLGLVLSTAAGIWLHERIERPMQRWILRTLFQERRSGRFLDTR